MALPIDSYARRSIGFGGEYEDNEDLQHESNEGGIRRAGREVGLRLADGISAWDFEKHRKNWHICVERMVAGLSGGMSVWRVDRFTRQSWDLEHMFRELDRAGRRGCVLMSMGMVYELDNPHIRKILRMEVIQAQSTSDATSFSSRQTLARQREQGVWNGAGKRIFGFPGGDMLAEPVGFGKTKRQPPVAEDLWRKERAYIKRGYRILLDGKKVVDVVELWNHAGLTGTLGTRWNPITVRQVLLRPLNCGRIAYKGEVVGLATNVEPIVDEDTFDRVQAMFAGRRRGRQVTGRHLASGIVKCGKCGAKLLSRPQWVRTGGPNATAIPGYRCSGKRCSLAIKREPMDAWLREFVVSRLSDPVAAKRISAVQLGRDSEIADLSAQLQVDLETRSALVKAFAKREMTRADWEETREILNKSITTLEARLEELRAASADVATVQVESREEVAREWDTAEAEGDTERLRQMLKEALRDLGEVRVRPAPGGKIPAQDRIELALFE